MMSIFSSDYEDSEVKRHYSETERPSDDSILSDKTLMAKQEMRNVVYKYQLEKFNSARMSDFNTFFMPVNLNVDFLWTSKVLKY